MTWILYKLQFFLGLPAAKLQFLLGSFLSIPAMPWPITSTAAWWRPSSLILRAFIADVRGCRYWSDLGSSASVMVYALQTVHIFAWNCKSSDIIDGSWTSFDDALEGWDRLGGVGQHPDGQLRRKGQPAYRIFRLIYLREESPHSFETLLVISSMVHHGTLCCRPVQLAATTVQWRVVRHRLEMTSELQPSKKNSPPSPLSHCSSRGPCNRVYPRRQKLLETYGLISECMKFSRLHRFYSMESNRAAIINFSDSNHAAILMSQTS